MPCTAFDRVNCEMNSSLGLNDITYEWPFTNIEANYDRNNLENEVTEVLFALNETAATWNDTSLWASTLLFASMERPDMDRNQLFVLHYISKLAVFVATDNKGWGEKKISATLGWCTPDSLISHFNRRITNSFSGVFNRYRPGNEITSTTAFDLGDDESMDYRPSPNALQSVSRTIEFETDDDDSDYDSDAETVTAENNRTNNVTNTTPQQAQTILTPVRSNDDIYDDLPDLLDENGNIINDISADNNDNEENSGYVTDPESDDVCYICQHYIDMEDINTINLSPELNQDSEACDHYAHRHCLDNGDHGFIWPRIEREDGQFVRSGAQVSIDIVNTETQERHSEVFPIGRFHCGEFLNSLPENESHAGIFTRNEGETEFVETIFPEEYHCDLCDTTFCNIVDFSSFDDAIDNGWRRTSTITGNSWACSRCVSNSNTTNNATNNATTNPFADTDDETDDDSDDDSEEDSEEDSDDDSEEDSDDDTDDEDEPTCIPRGNISLTCRLENCSNSRNFHSMEEAYMCDWERNDHGEWLCSRCLWHSRPSHPHNRYNDYDTDDY